MEATITRSRVVMVTAIVTMYLFTQCVAKDEEDKGENCERMKKILERQARQARLTTNYEEDPQRIHELG